jgi:hypothetical protein
MTCWADTPPPRVFESRRRAVSAATFITQFPRDGQPPRTVARARSRDRVGNFVEEDLVNLVVLGRFGEVARDRDTP